MTLATDLDQLAIDTIRTLSIDAVQKANSGHPGAPMGAAPMAYVLWTRFLRHAPTHPDWPDRDRFVLSAGHADMLLYSLLHLTGYAVSLEDLEAFRQWGSITPGHPECGLTPGVEATTGPLGQGFANAVGMAIAERRLGAEFDRPGHTVIDHRTFVIASDGDLQEGIASEAASLAGHLRLGKLVVLYDDNHVQLDGPTAMAWSEDVPGRFDAYGWHTQRVEDGNDLEAIERGHRDGRSPTTGRASSRSGPTSATAARTSTTATRRTARALGADEVRLTKEAYGWDPDRSFYVPDEAARLFRAAIPAGDALVDEWEARFAAYRDADPAAAAELRRRLDGTRLPDGWDADLKTYETGTEVATRNASQDAIAALAPRLPELFGGSADLSESNLTDVKGEPNFEAAEPGRNLRFGVREHAMGGAANGIALHGGFIPYCATFLTFSDYMRGSVRLAALTGLHVVYVWTHDSVGLGEDGPDPPAGRALRRPARDPEPVVRPAGRRERDGRRLGRRGRARRRSGRARPDPPEAADAGRHGPARARGRRPRRLRPARGVGRAPAADHDRDGLGAPAGLRGRRGARGRGHPDARRVAAVLGAVRPPGPGVPRRGPATRCPRAGERRDRRLARLGALGRRRGCDHRARSFRRIGAGRHDLRALRVHHRARHRRRAPRRPRGPARPDPDHRRRPFRPPPDARASARRASPGPTGPIPATPDRPRVTDRPGRRGPTTETSALDPRSHVLPMLAAHESTVGVPSRSRSRER